MIVSFPSIPNSYLHANTVCLDIILSLVRTRAIGYLRDIRRLTVALSRARLGLYILGRRSVFESVFELKPAFDMLLQRPDKLALITDEMFGQTQRPIPEQTNAPVEGEAIMQDVEHLGKYVYEMTKAKVEAMRQNGGILLPSREVNMGGVNGIEKVDDDDDREENVIVPEEVPAFADDDDEVDGGVAI